MSPSARRADPPPRPTFVFKGTIRRVGDTTMKDVPADTRTAVVQVEHVIESPQDLTRLAGQEITVQLAGRGSPKAGAEMVFHTIPLMFGESVLVKSLKQERATKARAARAAGGDPVERKAARDLQERAHDADVIVSGRVVTVTLPEEIPPPLGAVSAAAAKPARIRPISEHDPKWRDASVEVEAVHKGRPGLQTIKVRFPASTDVRWYKSPKFQPGQHGTFILHKTPMPPAASPARLAATRRAATKVEPEVYTALHPADFQPDTEAPAVASMISRAATSTSGSGIRGSGSDRRKTTKKKTAKKKTAKKGSGSTPPRKKRAAGTPG
jgi:hypothetical protein